MTETTAPVSPASLQNQGLQEPEIYLSGQLLRQGLKPAPVGLYARESDDNYPVVAHLDDRHRVISCRDGIQWIVQRRMNTGGSGWRGLSFCRTREALICDAERRLGRPIPKEAAAILNALPAILDARQICRP